jgi:hypothetical protein
MSEFQKPFLGAEAIASGLLRKHQLRNRFESVLPGVYVPRAALLTLPDRAHAAWLWSRRQGIIVGTTAAALHGSRWVDDESPVEILCSNARPPRGVRTRTAQLFAAELMTLGCLPVTTPERTGFDIGRRRPTGPTVAAMDALLRATGVGRADISEIAQRHPGVRGLRQLETVLDLVDAGAQSPKETWLRLLLVAGGLPRPTTQIPVRSAASTFYLDMGWEDLMVAVEYDGEQHRTDRWQYTKDIRRSEELARLGWIVVRVVAGDRPADILRRVREALGRRSANLR